MKPRQTEKDKIRDITYMRNLKKKKDANELIYRNRVTDIANKFKGERERDKLGIWE